MRALAVVALTVGLALSGCKNPPPPPDESGCHCDEGCLCPHCKGEPGATRCNCKAGAGAGGEKKDGEKKDGEPGK